MDPDRKRQQRQYIAFAWVAAVVILLLAWLQSQHGTAQTVGLVIGLPIIAILLLIAIRFGRRIRRP
jgi:chromate transport protein ChrA